MGLMKGMMKGCRLDSHNRPSVSLKNAYILKRGDRQGEEERRIVTNFLKT
jgi:hypothetical protein